MIKICYLRTCIDVFLGFFESIFIVRIVNQDLEDKPGMEVCYVDILVGSSFLLAPQQQTFFSAHL